LTDLTSSHNRRVERVLDLFAKALRDLDMGRDEELWWGAPFRPERRKADRRRCARYAVPASRQAGRLTIGSSTWPVRVVEISSTGFTLLASHAMEELRIGLSGHLQTADGKFAVRVANVSEVKIPKVNSPPAKPALRIGLSHLGELTPSKGRLAGLRPWKSRAHWRWRLSQRALTMVLTVVVLAIVLLPILLVANVQSPDRDLLRSWFLWGRHAVGLGAPSGAQPPPPAAADVAPSPAADSPDVRSVRHLAQVLPGPDAFAAPEVVRALGLTHPQQAKLDELIQATTWALRDVDRRWQGASRGARDQTRARLLDAARLEALKILTPSQQVAWAKLTQ
jgi:hypothetical protein